MRSIFYIGLKYTTQNSAFCLTIYLAFDDDEKRRNFHNMKNRLSLEDCPALGYTVSHMAVERSQCDGCCVQLNDIYLSFKPDFRRKFIGNCRSKTF